MPELGSLRDALVEEIQDLYDAEHQLSRVLPRMANAVNDRNLRSVIEAHLEDARNRLTRLEEVFVLLRTQPRAKHCAGIAGIIQHTCDALYADAAPEVTDARIIAGGQRVEHYEIAAYGTAVAWAEALELTEVAEILAQCLEEERAADEELSLLAEGGINQAAMRAEPGAADPSPAGRAG